MYPYIHGCGKMPWESAGMYSKILLVTLNFYIELAGTARA